MTQDYKPHQLWIHGTPDGEIAKDDIHPLIHFGVTQKPAQIACAKKNFLESKNDLNTYIYTRLNLKSDEVITLSDWFSNNVWALSKKLLSSTITNELKIKIEAFLEELRDEMMTGGKTVFYKDETIVQFSNILMDSNIKAIEYANEVEYVDDKNKHELTICIIDPSCIDVVKYESIPYIDILRTANQIEKHRWGVTSNGKTIDHIIGEIKTELQKLERTIR